MNVRISTARLTTVCFGCNTGGGLVGGVVGTVSVEVGDEASRDDEGLSDDDDKDMAGNLCEVGWSRVVVLKSVRFLMNECRP